MSKTARRRARSHHGPPPAAAHGRHAARPARTAAAARPRVLDGLVDGEDEAGGLRGRRDGVDLDDGRLPHAGRKVVGDILGEDVDAVPAVVLLKVSSFNKLTLTVNSNSEVA